MLTFTNAHYEAEVVSFQDLYRYFKPILMEISTPVSNYFFLDWTDYNIIPSFISQANEVLADVLKP